MKKATRAKREQVRLVVVKEVTDDPRGPAVAITRARIDAPRVVGWTRDEVTTLVALRRAGVPLLVAVHDEAGIIGADLDSYGDWAE